MTEKSNNSNDLSIDEIEQLLESQTDRVNKGLAWLLGGIAVTLFTLASPVQVIAWGAILYGLSNIVNGNTLKKRYKRMLPENLLPPEINCQKCGVTLELNSDERTSQEYFCPTCNQAFLYSTE